ncbi:hypothetical protein OAA_13820 [Vibrio cyclitrophicus 1F175]|uniref:hypothetical protein n=1 Tax=Vibrio TaxID=662 RepID=UPI0003122358|nr:hypothetical protein [Vibrio cyclitrophicus]OEF63559.1 hypothetical protein OAA_13820 [Vibrio cyclitrophicus 1F175]
MIVDIGFIEWLRTNYNVEEKNGFYGSFCELNGADIWTRQRGGSYQLFDSNFAREIYQRYQNS